MNILIYALGGGWGHLTRASALALALAGKARVRILANSPYLSVVRTAMPELNIVAVSTREDVSSHLAREPFDVLVVDTFPRGLGGELASLLPSWRSPKVLIHRDLNPEYAAWANLRAFVAAHYDAVLCPGERGPLADLPRSRFTAPWLFRAPAAGTSAVDVVICAGGNPVELSWYGEVAALLAREVRLRCLAAQLPPGCPRECWIRHWPSIDWTARAGAVVGGAGYNTVHECRAFGVPLVARPWPRKYDRQRMRAERFPGITIVESAEQAAQAALEALARPRNPPPVFENGAGMAAAFILSLGGA